MLKGTDFSVHLPWQQIY